MKILVCVSKTPDTTSKISFINNDTVFNASGIQFIMNPYDEWYALVKAIEIKEKNGASVTIINIGNAENDPIIRKGLALGADDAVRIDAEATSAYFTAKQIANYAQQHQFDIIFTGKETIDYNGSEVGGMIAELLDLPFISYASHMDLNGNTAIIEREIEGGSEELEVNTPFVISTAKGMAEQRIPNMMGIMKAKSKPLDIISPIANENWSHVTNFDLPPAKTGVKLINPDNMDELVRLLHEEAKVI